MTRPLSVHAQDLLRFSRMPEWEDGYPVIGVPDRIAVRQLEERGLVTLEATLDDGMGFEGVIRPVSP